MYFEAIHVVARALTKEATHCRPDSTAVEENSQALIVQTQRIK